MTEILLHRPNFLAFIILFLVGLYIMILHHNLVKKLIGMYLMQTSILLFFITLAVKKDSTVPILLPAASNLGPEAYANPLPHVLMLTAIVVGVSTLGVSLAMVIALYRHYHSLEEDQIMEKMQ